MNVRAAGDPELKLYSIFGYPLTHTISPAIQNRAFDHYGLKSVYFALERTPSRFRFLMRHLKTLLLDGFNITAPFKELVVPYLDRLSREARLIGSVNTAKKEGNRWVGYNTDHHGFLAGLREAGFNASGKFAVVIGAGGSARAVVYALATKGARRLVVANRTQARARRLVRRFRGRFPSVAMTATGLEGMAFERAVREADLVVNATKVGLNREDPLLVTKRVFPRGRILFYDLIYRPRRTKLLRVAARCGHRIQNGETMVLHQGAKAFEIWTQRGAPIRLMKEALHAALRAS